MIWDPLNDTRCPDAGEDQGPSGELAQRVRGLLSVAGDATGTASQKISALCDAIEAFLASGNAAFKPESSTTASMVACALNAMGDSDAARRVLVFGSGTARAARWRSCGEDPVWVLDLERVCSTEMPPLEMTFWLCLRLTLDALDDVWTETDGQGALGLRHLAKTAIRVLGSESRPSALRAFENELIRECRAAMNSMARRRRWKAVPSVVNLDLVK